MIFEKIYTIELTSLRYEFLHYVNEEKISLELANFFIKKYNKKFRKTIKGLEQKAIQALYEYPWPGNVRELENVMEYAILTTDTEMLSLENIKMKIPISLKRDDQ